MTPAPQQAPKEHCGHECNGEVCHSYRDYMHIGQPCPANSKNLECKHDTRPHPAPAQKQIDCPRCEGHGTLCNHPKASECEGESCPIDDRDKCDPKCKYMVPCDVCQHDATIRAEAARKAREDMLDKLTVAVADMGFPMIDKTNEFDDGRACAYGYFMREIAKLRSTQHPGQEE